MKKKYFATLLCAGSSHSFYRLRGIRRSERREEAENKQKNLKSYKQKNT